MTTNYQVIVQNSEGVLNSQAVGESTVNIVAQGDTAIELRQIDTGVAPQEALFKRNNGDLEVWMGNKGASGEPDLIVSNFYTVDNPPAFVGLAEDGSYYSFVPQSGLEEGLLLELEDGESEFQSLGYDTVFSAFPLWPVLLGAGIIGGAIIANNLDDDKDDDNPAVDTTAPDAPIINPTNGQEINGTAEAGSTVNVDVDGDGTADYTTTAGTDGSWSVDPDPDLADGTTVSATATDEAGNESDPTTAIVDAVAPNAPVINPTNGQEISGTAEAGSTVNVDVDGDGTTDYTTTAGTDGSWSVNPEPDLVDGTEVSATATDEAGNTSDPGTAIVDATAPTVGLDPLTTQDTTPPLTGTVVDNDNDATIVVTVDGNDYQAVNNGDGTWTLADNTLPAQPEGDVTVTVTATDAAGNTNQTTGDITIDLGAAPNVTIDPLTTNDTTPELTGTIDAPTATINVNVGGTDYPATNNGDGTWTLADNTLPVQGEGDVTVTVTATQGGQTGTATEVITIDTTAPTNGDGNNSIALDDGGDELISTSEATNLTLSGTVEPEATINSIVLTDVNNNSITVAAADITVDANGNVSVTGQDLSGLDDGEITATMNVSDVAGNSGNITDTSTLDTASPSNGDGKNSITMDDGGDELISTSEATNLTLSGTVEPGATINSIVFTDVNNNSITVAAADITVDANGNVSVTGQDLSGLDDGEITATMNVSDAAGNAGNISDTSTLDTTSPVSSSISIDDGGDELISTSEATNLTLSGTVEPGATINSIVFTDVNNNSITVAAADITVDANGNVSVTGQDISSLDDGQITATMNVSDAAGNASNITDTSTLDTASPSNGDGNNSITIEDGGDGTLSEAEAGNISLTGTVEPGATINSIILTDVNNNSITVAAADIDVDANGNVSVTGQDISGLDNGIITATMNVSDAAGNTGNITDTSILDVQYAPQASLGESTALLGLVGADALNAINLGESQAFTAFDANNDITNVYISTSGLSVNLGDVVTFNYSQEMADAFGLTIVTTSQGLLGGVASITITSANGQTIDNQLLNEFLGTVYQTGDGLLNLGVAPSFEMEVTDSQGNTVTDSANELLNADALNASGPSVNLIEGDNNVNTLDYSAETANLRIYGYDGDDDITGGSGNDLIRGGDGNDTMNGGAGDDVIFAGNGNDIVDAGEGDDSIYLVGDESTSINGGAGTDTLVLNQNLNLDFSSSNLGITNIEKIDFGDDTTTLNTLTLTEQAVKDLTDVDDELIINGNATDTVAMTGGTLEGTTTINGTVYSEYSLGTATVYVDEDVNVNV